MWTRVIQDWVTVGRNFVASGPTRIVQSTPVPTDPVQDALFEIDVKEAFVTGTTVTLAFETAPANEDGLFLPMQTPVNLVGLVGTRATVAALASSTSGPPMAKYVRWVLDSPDSATWNVCSRITMSAM